MESYNLHCKFDVNMHRLKYPYYTEVVILPDGDIQYAVPSHQEKLISICMDVLGVTRSELNDMCPKEYYADFGQWLCNISNTVSVWYKFTMIPTAGVTIEQQKALQMLKDNHCYVGEVPKNVRSDI